MNFEIPQSEFEIYPMGNDEGIIVECEDRGKEKNPFYGLDPQKPGREFRHQVAVYVQSVHHNKTSGEPFLIEERMQLSGDIRSNLRKFRSYVAGRELTTEEAHQFSSDEILGVRIGFIIRHRPREGKDPWAYLDGINRLPEERQQDGSIYWTPDRIQALKVEREKAFGAPSPGPSQASQDNFSYNQNPQGPPPGHPANNTQSYNPPNPDGSYDSNTGPPSGQSHPGIGQPGFFPSDQQAPPANAPPPLQTPDDDLPFS